MSDTLHYALCFLAGVLIGLILFTAIPILLGILAHIIWAGIDYGWNL